MIHLRRGDEPPAETDRGDPNQVSSDARLHVVRRLRQRVQRYRALELTWRLSVLAIGTVIVLAGVAMLVLPGPGLLTIFVGLAVLGSEFHWAQRLLGWVRARFERAAEQALDPAVRRRNQAILAGILVGLAVGTWWYVGTYGLPTTVELVLDRF